MRIRRPPPHLENLIEHLTDYLRVLEEDTVDEDRLRRLIEKK